MTMQPNRDVLTIDPAALDAVAGGRASTMGCARDMAISVVGGAILASRGGGAGMIGGAIGGGLAAWHFAPGCRDRDGW